MAVEQALAQFKETEGGEAFRLQNSKLLKVELAGVEIQAKLGSMVAYQGDVSFGALSGGLYNMELSGTGNVALVSDGPPVLIEIDGESTFADPQAAITWSQGVSSSVKTDVNVKTLVGKGSGETFQLAFSGSGWLLLQPSEGSAGTPAGGGAGGAIGSLLGGR
jgi:uncharacterized protein (AIM24 family)